MDQNESRSSYQVTDDDNQPQTGTLSTERSDKEFLPHTPSTALTE